jgi:hypothetical protein
MYQGLRTKLDLPHASSIRKKKREVVLEEMSGQKVPSLVMFQGDQRAIY